MAGFWNYTGYIVNWFAIYPLAFSVILVSFAGNSLHLKSSVACRVSLKVHTYALNEDKT